LFVHSFRPGIFGIVDQGLCSVLRPIKIEWTNAKKTNQIHANGSDTQRVALAGVD